MPDYTLEPMPKFVIAIRHDRTGYMRYVSVNHPPTVQDFEDWAKRMKISKREQGEYIWARFRKMRGESG